MITLTRGTARHRSNRPVTSGLEFAAVARVSAIIVSYADPDATRAAVASLRAQTRPPDQVIVVDNHPDRPVRDVDAELVHPDGNLGYAGGVRAGVGRSEGDWLLLLNPDAVADPDCLARMLEAGGDDVGVVGAQVLQPDGRVNAGDNPLHVTGVSWSGRYLEAPETGPPRPAAVVSGAAQLVRRALWDEIGGMADRYFLYHEEVDLCWRARLAGWEVRFQPRARVVHDYAFDKGAEKWFWLERNRAWTVLCAYGAPALALVAPVLVAGEAAIVARALREGWEPEKRRAYASVWRERRELRARRRAVQATRRTGDAAIVARMTGRMDTSLVDGGLAERIGPLLDAYRRGVVGLLALAGRWQPLPGPAPRSRDAPLEGEGARLDEAP
jgi:GT2 family glycosyltransferase